MWIKFAAGHDHCRRLATQLPGTGWQTEGWRGMTGRESPNRSRSRSIARDGPEKSQQLPTFPPVRAVQRQEARSWDGGRPGVQSLSKAKGWDRNMETGQPKSLSQIKRTPTLD
jgi:hypothetical protein